MRRERSEEGAALLAVTLFAALVALQIWAWL